MTERKPNLLPIIGGAAVVVAGGVGAYFFFNKPAILPTITASTTGTLTVVPKQSLMAVSISTDDAALAKLEQFLSPETKKIYDTAIAQFRSNLASGDVDYDKDVKPWIGKSVSLAFLPSVKSASLVPQKSLTAIQTRYVPMGETGSIQFVQDTPDKPAPEPTPTPEKPTPEKPTPEKPAVAPTVPNILFVIEVKDNVAAEKFLTDKIKVKSGGKEKQSEYKGVKITKYGEGAGSSFTAIVGNYMIVTPREEATQKAIDTFKGEASLASATGAEDLKLRNPLAQIYIPNFGESIVELAALNPEAKTIAPESLEQLKKVKSVNLGLAIDDSGIRLKALGKFEPSTISVFKNSPNKIITQVPSQAFALITGFNIKDSWEQFVKSSEKNPEIKKSIDEARTQFKAAPLEIDLDKDIFGWMDGEFTLAAVLGQPNGILTQTQGIAPLILLQTTNRAAAESLLKKLDDLVAKNGIKVAQKDVGGVSVTDWSDASVGGIISHGWSQKDTVFITASPIVSLFVPKSATLETDSAYKSAISSLPTNNVGYFYLDVDRTWSIFPATEKEKTSPDLKALIASVRGLAVTATYPNQESAEVEAILVLKKGGQ